MPIVPDTGFPVLKQQIKVAFDNAVIAAGGTTGPPTASINEALATEIATAINTYVKAAIVQVIVNGAATPDVAGGVVTGQGTG